MVAQIFIRPQQLTSTINNDIGYRFNVDYIVHTDHETAVIVWEQTRVVLSNMVNMCIHVIDIGPFHNLIKESKLIAISKISRKCTFINFPCP